MADGADPKFLHDNFIEWCGNQPVPVIEEFGIVVDCRLEVNVHGPTHVPVRGHGKRLPVRRVSRIYDNDDTFRRFFADGILKG